MNLETKKMDLKIEKFEIPAIKSNFDEIKTKLEKVLEKYEGLVFTKETLQSGKDTRAELNRLKKLFEDKRKEIKKQIMSPYTEFEVKVKELVALIETPIETIDSQIKTFERDKKEKKRININEIYDSLIENLKDIIPLEKIFNEKWLNVNKSSKSINDEISIIIEKTKKDLQIINDFKSDFDIELKNCYSNTLDISEVLTLKNQLEERKRKIEEEKKEEPQETEKPKIEEKKEEPQKEVQNDEVKEELFSFSIKLTTTTTKKDLLKKFLLDNSITFEII